MEDFFSNDIIRNMEFIAATEFMVWICSVTEKAKDGWNMDRASKVQEKNMNWLIGKLEEQKSGAGRYGGMGV